MHQAINFEEKFGNFAERWSPRVVAEMNEYQFKLVKLQGEFVWHSHAETDEAFVVLDGEMRIDFRDGAASRRDVRGAAWGGTQAVCGG